MGWRFLGRGMDFLLNLCYNREVNLLHFISDKGVNMSEKNFKKPEKTRVEIVGNAIILHKKVDKDDHPYEDDPLLRLWYPIQDEYWDKSGKGRRLSHMVMIAKRGLDMEKQPTVTITLMPNEVTVKDKKLSNELVARIMSEAQYKYIDALVEYIEK